MLQNVILRDNADDGIDAEEGAGVEVYDSNIRNNRKGIYMRSGSQITVRSSLIEANRQEGIDILGYSNSTIIDNQITRNGESGIEVIVGGSSSQIKSNVISDNHKSGVVVEYSKLAPELGTLHLKGNEILRNAFNGVRCTSRTGGTRQYRYFAKSVLEEDNIVANSGDKDFTTLCKFGSVPFEGSLNL